MRLPFTRPRPLKTTVPPRTRRSPPMTSRICTDPPYTCTVPDTGLSTELFSFTKYESVMLCPRSAPVAPVGERTTKSATRALRVISGTTSRLYIDPLRRPAQQQEKDRVDGDEQHGYGRSAERTAGVLEQLEQPLHRRHFRDDRRRGAAHRGDAGRDAKDH